MCRGVARYLKFKPILSDNSSRAGHKTSYLGRQSCPVGSRRHLDDAHRMLADEGRVFQPRPAPPPRSARPARAGAAGRAPAGETLMMRSSRGVQLAIALDGTAFPRQSPVRAGGWRGARRNLTDPLILSATEQPRPGIPPLPRLRVGAGYRPLLLGERGEQNPAETMAKGRTSLTLPKIGFPRHTGASRCPSPGSPLSRE